MKIQTLIIVCATLWLACENEPPKETTAIADTLVDTSSVVLATTPSPALKKTAETTWINEFKYFRQALDADDRVKLKTFFNFPVTEEDSSLWYLCHLSEEDRAKRNASVENPDFFYEQDFDNYYQRIFDQKFLQAILKVKAAELFEKGVTETEEFPDPNHPYKLYVNLDEQLQILQFNMSFYNNPDENGVYHSEGEHNLIYLFDVIDGKKLKFKRIVFAG